MEEKIVRNRTKADLASTRQRQATGRIGRVTSGKGNRASVTQDRSLSVSRQRGTSPSAGRVTRRHSDPVASGASDPAGLPLLRTSERGTFKRCRFLWWHEFELKLKPLTDVPPLRFGNLIHQSLASYYIPGKKKRGVRPWVTFEELYERECKAQESFGFRVGEDEVWTAAGDLGPAMLKHYVEHYTSGVPEMPDEDFDIVATEIVFRRVIYRPESYDPNYPPEAQASAVPWFIYVGIMDGLWRHRRTKRLHIVDHKTAKAIQPRYLSLDPQSTAYWTWGLDWVYEQGILKPDEKPAGMIFNILRKAKPDERPKTPEGLAANKDGSVSKRQPAPYFARIPIYRDFNERELARATAEREFMDIERVREEGELPYKNAGQFTCPGCWLFDVCELHEIGQDYEELRQVSTKSWDPYAQHEIEAAERK